MLPELSETSDLQRLQNMAREYVVDYPDLHDLAQSAAQKILFQHAGQHLNPDKVYWHRFTAAVSSSRSFTGWQHTGTPIESMTLTQLVLHRFNPNDQEATDELQLYGGFYTDAAAHGVFDERNEVRLLPQDVLRDFWALDFSGGYRAKMARFWERHSEVFCMLAKATFLVHIALSRANKTLLAVDDQTLSSLMALTADSVSTVAWLQTPMTSNAQASVRYLEVGAFKARDILRIVGPQGRQILYIPGEATPFQCFDGPEQLYLWLRDQFMFLNTRTRLLSHFMHPVADAQQRSALEWCVGLLVVNDQQPAPALVNADDQPIPGDPFVYLREVARREMAADADVLLTSNGDLRKRIWIGYLNAFLEAFGDLSVMAWPLALTAVGASIANAGLNIDQAVNGKTAQQRRAGVLGAISNIIYLVLNLPLLDAMKKDTWSARFAAQESVPEVNTIEVIPAPAATEPAVTTGDSNGSSQNGMSAPLRLIHSPFWDTYMQLNPIDEARYATDALARQKTATSMFQFESVQGAAPTGAGEDISFEQWSAGHQMSQALSEGFGPKVRNFTANEAAYNQFLRTGVPFLPNQVEDITALAREIASIGYNNEATLYRGGIGKTGILGTAFSSGRIKVGDVLVSTEFTLFSENPYRTRVFAGLQGDAQAGVNASPVTFDDTSVVFVLSEKQYLHATPIASFSAHPEQAESVFLPGRYFQITRVEHTVGAFYSFVKVDLLEVNGPLAGRGFLDLRTGEPFVLERYAFTLGPVGRALVDTFLTASRNAEMSGLAD